jgi:hypothetical protein
MTALNCHLESPLLPSGGGNNALVLRPYLHQTKKEEERFEGRQPGVWRRKKSFEV